MWHQLSGAFAEFATKTTTAWSYTSSSKNQGLRARPVLHLKKATSQLASALRPTHHFLRPPPLKFSDQDLSNMSKRPAAPQDWSSTCQDHCPKPSASMSSPPSVSSRLACAKLAGVQGSGVPYNFHGLQKCKSLHFLYLFVFHFLDELFVQAHFGSNNLAIYSCYGSDSAVVSKRYMKKSPKLNTTYCILLVCEVKCATSKEEWITLPPLQRLQSNTRKKPAIRNGSCQIKFEGIQR